MALVTLFKSVIASKDHPLPEERLKLQTITLIILIYLGILLFSIPFSFLLPRTPAEQQTLTIATLTWIGISLIPLALARRGYALLAASLFAAIVTLSVVVTILIDPSPAVYTFATPFFIIPIIVSFLYGEYKNSLILSAVIFIILNIMTLAIPSINFEHTFSSLLFFLIATGLLLAAHNQRKVEREILEKERERSLHDMRLRSMGELTANIAHQMGTPLTVIEMAIENARANFQTGKSARAYDQLDICEDTIMKSKRFLDTLKNLYQPQKVSSGSCSLAWILAQVRLFYGPRLAAQKVVLTASGDFLHESIPLPGEDLLQCILNLVDNGLQALKGQANASIKFTLKKNENQLTLSYSDNGPGIPRSHHSHIFDPFFTTKDLGEGTGLGLAITKAILQRYNASIELARSEQKGASFHLLFKLPPPAHKG